jgi:hypothetical protein
MASHRLRGPALPNSPIPRSGSCSSRCCKGVVVHADVDERHEVTAPVDLQLAPLAHIGFMKYRLFDRDGADESNLNRWVIATEEAAAATTLKVEPAKRRILSIGTVANVETLPCRWQERPEPLRGCEIVFGCVDGFAELLRDVAAAIRGPGFPTAMNWGTTS